MDIKKDIMSGKIWGLELLDSASETICSNRYADIYKVPRKITKYDDDKFYLRTTCYNTIPRYEYVNGEYRLIDVILPTKQWEDDFEAYYNAFDYYDGNYLINKEKGTVYQVLWSY